MEIIFSLKEWWPPAIAFGVCSIGLALSFRFLHFADFTSLASVNLGGVVCIAVANTSSLHFGVLAALFTGLALGAVTGLLATGFGKDGIAIQPVLAGIIVFVGARSFGLWLTSGGTIQANMAVPVVFDPKVSLGDVGIMLCIALGVAWFAATVLHSSFGSLLLAMSGSDRFVRFRHRQRVWVFVVAVALSNSIVAFGGCLFALQQRVQSVDDKGELMLVFALGGIFAGNAIRLAWRTLVTWVRSAVKEEKHLGTNSWRPNIESGHLFFVYLFTTGLIVLFWGWSMGSGLDQLFVTIGLGEFSGVATLQEISERGITARHVDPNDLRYVVVAVLILLFAWAGRLDTSRRGDPF